MAQLLKIISLIIIILIIIYYQTKNQECKQQNKQLTKYLNPYVNQSHPQLTIIPNREISNHHFMMPSHSMNPYLIDKINNPIIPTYMYKQIGVLIATNPEIDQNNKIVQLYGQRIDRYKYKYYVMASSGQQIIKIMLDERKYCKEIYDGDKMTIPELNNMIFSVKLYDDKCFY